MSIQTDLTRIANAKAAIIAAIEGKGVTVLSGVKLDALAALIESIEAGGGGRKILEGSITPSSDVINFTVTHDFGVIPSFACWFLSDKDSTGFSKNDALIGVAFRDITTQFLAKTDTAGSYNYINRIQGAFYTKRQITYGVAGNDNAWAVAKTTTIIANSSDNGGYFRAGKTYQYILIGD